MSQTKRYKPFNLPRHTWGSCEKNLRPVSVWMCQRATISVESNICDTCRRKLMRSPIIDIPDEQVGSGGRDYTPETGVHIAIPEDQIDSETEPGIYVDLPAAIGSLNKYLSEIGVTPYSKKKACQPHYPNKRMDEITKAMRQMIISAESDDGDESEIIKRLKDKFKTTTQRSEQKQILTVASKLVN